MRPGEAQIPFAFMPAPVPGRCFRDALYPLLRDAHALCIEWPEKAGIAEQSQELADLMLPDRFTLTHYAKQDSRDALRTFRKMAYKRRWALCAQWLLAQDALERLRLI
jgi:hypothetical protein